MLDSRVSQRGLAQSCGSSTPQDVGAFAMRICIAAMLRTAGGAGQSQIGPSRSPDRAGARSQRWDTRRVSEQALANKRLIERFYEAFDHHDGEAMAACYAPDARFHDPV